MLPTDRVCARVAPTSLCHWCAQDNGPHWNAAASRKAYFVADFDEPAHDHPNVQHLHGAVRRCECRTNRRSLHCVGVALVPHNVTAYAKHNHVISGCASLATTPPPFRRPPARPKPPGPLAAVLLPSYRSTRPCNKWHITQAQTHRHTWARTRRSLTPTHSHLQVDLCVVDFGQLQRCTIKPTSENRRERAVQAKHAKAAE